MQGRHVAARPPPRVHHAVEEQVAGVGVGDLVGELLVLPVANAEVVVDEVAQDPEPVHVDVVVPLPRCPPKAPLERRELLPEFGRPPVGQPLVIGNVQCGEGGDAPCRRQIHFQRIRRRQFGVGTSGQLRLGLHDNLLP